ncbi:MAG: hypothetical protein J7M18_02685, partial [Candidatus Eremiobacteraeota bacterium]|nr:hypothetical protein [Candidatus Eremiobacteraeota bacterium]
MNRGRLHFLVVILIFIFLASAIPCDAGRQIDGFSIGKWGMSRDDVEKALFARKIKIKNRGIDDGAPYIETSETIYNTPITVRYVFNPENENLTMIRIVVSGRIIGDGFYPLTAQKRIDSFIRHFEQNLTRRHGFPVEKDTRKIQSPAKNLGIEEEVISCKVWERD